MYKKEPTPTRTSSIDEKTTKKNPRRVFQLNDNDDDIIVQKIKIGGRRKRYIFFT